AACVAKAIVQPVVAVLPELPGRGGEAEAAPRLRPRWLRAGELRDAALELGPVVEHLTLSRDDRAEARAGGTGREVRVRLGVRDALDPTFDAHLTAEGIPVEEERSLRVLLELAALAA